MSRPRYLNVEAKTEPHVQEKEPKSKSRKQHDGPLRNQLKIIQLAVCAAKLTVLISFAKPQQFVSR